MCGAWDRRLWRHEDKADNGGSNCGGVVATCLKSWHQRWWRVKMVSTTGGWELICGSWQLVANGLWVLWSEAGTNVGHWLGRRCWLLYWLGDEKLMWGLRGIYGLQGLVWACSRSHGAKTWKVLSYLARLLFWWFCYQVVVYDCVVWTGSLLWYQK